MKSIDFCMFVTWDGERQRARPLSARPDREAGRIDFLVDEGGAKDEQVARFPKVTLAFADTRSHDYVAITGTARVSDDRARIGELWTAADNAWWDDAEDPSIRLLTVDARGRRTLEGPEPSRGRRQDARRRRHRRQGQLRRERQGRPPLDRTANARLPLIAAGKPSRHGAPGRRCQPLRRPRSGFGIASVAVDQDQRRRSLEQEHDLARPLGGGRHACPLEEAGPPASTAALWRCAIARAGWPGRSASSMARRVNPAPVHAGFADHLASSAKSTSMISSALPRIAVLVLADARQRQLAVALEHRRQQVVLALEVIVERALGDPRRRGDLVDADAAEALPVEQLVGGIEDAAPGRSARLAIARRYPGECIPTSEFTSPPPRPPDVRATVSGRRP